RQPQSILNQIADDYAPINTIRIKPGTEDNPVIENIVTEENARNIQNPAAGQTELIRKAIRELAEDRIRREDFIKARQELLAQELEADIRANSIEPVDNIPENKGIDPAYMRVAKRNKELQDTSRLDD